MNGGRPMHGGCPMSPSRGPDRSRPPVRRRVCALAREQRGGTV